MDNLFICSYLFGLLLSSVSSLCDFPDYLLTKDIMNQWRFVVNEGHDSRIIFKKNYFLADEFQPGTTIHYNVTCYKYFGAQDNYLIRIHRGGVKTGFQCVQFHPKTANIIGVSLNNNTRNKVDCTKQEMVLSPWLLIAVRPRPIAPTKCPISGSYYFQTKYYGSGDFQEVLCDWMESPSLLTSECLPGDGITLQFPTETCIPPSTGWAKDYHILCLESWSDDDFDYALLGVEYNRPDWVLRLPMNRNDTFIMEMYFGLMAPSSDTSALPKEFQRHLEFNMTIKADRSICMDDLTSCHTDYCDAALYSSVCRQTCDVCDNTTTSEKSCTFAKQFVGTWVESNNKLVITDDVISVEDFGDFRCIEEYSPNKEDKDYYRHYVTKSEFQNGCVPRYTCVWISSITDKALQYQIGYSNTDTSKASILCDQTQFVVDPYTIRNPYRSSSATLLVEYSSVFNHSVPCRLGGVYFLNYTNPAMYPCTGYISDVTSDPDTLVIDYLCGTVRDQRVYKCLDPTLVSSQIWSVITKEVTQDGQDDMEEPPLQCWSLQRHQSIKTTRDSFGAFRMTLCNDESYKLTGLASFVSNTTVTLPPEFAVPPFTYSSDIPDDTNGTSLPEVTSHGSYTGVTSPFGNSENQTGSPQDADTEGGVPHVVGIVFGCILGIILVGCVVFVAWRFYRSRRKPYRVLEQPAVRYSA